MAEREAEVVGATGRTLSLRLIGSACEGCAGGCGGRCSLFAGAGRDAFELDVEDITAFPPGHRLRLRLDDQALRRAAWRGYGRVLAGLLAGAVAGQLVALAWGRHADLLTLLGLVSGTLLAARFSKPRLPEPEILSAAAEPTSETQGRTNHD